MKSLDQLDLGVPYCPCGVSTTYQLYTFGNTSRNVISLIVHYKMYEAKNTIYEEESLLGVNIVERLLWKRSFFLEVLRSHHVIAAPAHCVLKCLIH